MSDRVQFSERCEAASSILHMLAQQAKGDFPDPVLFVEGAYQQTLDAIADVLKAFAKVQLVDK